MKKSDTHIKAVISAAVISYIKSREEVAAASSLMVASRGSTMLERGPFIRTNTWGAGGRASQMQVRTMMQLKSFHR